MINTLYGFSYLGLTSSLSLLLLSFFHEYCLPAKKGTPNPTGLPNSNVCIQVCTVSLHPNA